MSRGGQEGQMLVLGAMVLAFFFVPLGVYVIDTGLVEAGYAQLSETVQMSAEDGASMLDEAAYRSSGKVVLDPEAARAIADQSMRVSRIPGLQSWSVAIGGQTVTVTARLQIRLFALGSTTIVQTREARLVYGQ
ncbi:MAG: hypothetical protein ACYDGR_01890 [Candidatus Dormibacteria bacterium]